MSAITVRNTTEYLAVHALDEDAEEIVNRWLREANPDEKIPPVDMSGPRELGLWILRHPSGSVLLVPSADFLVDFEETDPVADFAAELSSVTSEDEPEEDSN